MCWERSGRQRVAALTWGLLAVHESLKPCRTLDSVTAHTLLPLLLLWHTNTPSDAILSSSRPQGEVTSDLDHIYATELG